MILSPNLMQSIASNLPSQGTIVDIGCGTGDLLEFLSSQHTYQLFGSEPDERKRLQAMNKLSAEIISASAESLPYEADKFDAVIMECTFSLCETKKTIKELSRILKDDGVLIIADLFARNENAALADNQMIKNIYDINTMQSFFLNSFEPISFEEHTSQLRSTLAQMVMDRTLCLCCEDMQTLRRAKTGYGLWIWKKRSAEHCGS